MLSANNRNGELKKNKGETATLDLLKSVIIGEIWGHSLLRENEMSRDGSAIFCR